MDETAFRAAYDKDAANRAKQSWDEYARWVRVFYEGKSFPPVPGWTKRERDILAAVAPSERERVEPRLKDIATRLASEWAKDNAVRRVSTGDLQTWGAEIERAAKEGKASEGIEHVAAALQRRGV